MVRLLPQPVKNDSARLLSSRLEPPGANPSFSVSPVYKADLSACLPATAPLAEVHLTRLEAKKRPDSSISAIILGEHRPVPCAQ